MNHPDSTRQDIVGTGRGFPAETQAKFTSRRTPASSGKGDHEGKVQMLAGLSS
jgi:hypothetical protein